MPPKKKPAEDVDSGNFQTRAKLLLTLMTTFKVIKMRFLILLNINRLKTQNDNIVREIPQ